MPFKSGESGNPAGRPLGTNKKYIEKKATQIAETLDEVGVDPIWILSQQLISNKPYVAQKAAEILLPYFLPKLKSIEHSGNKENPINFTVYTADDTARLLEEIVELKKALSEKSG